MGEWKTIDSAPKDGTRVLVAGFWNERAAKHCRGQAYICVGAWSTFMSDGTSYEWIYEGPLGNTRHIRVTFTHWTELPPPPKD